jgi:23S rRNA (uracil1939-C5)-methyltransferase
VPGTCGGCDLLDLAAPAALAVREGIVRDALVRVGKLERALVERAVLPILASPPGEESRRRRTRVVMESGKPTFSSAESHRRVGVAACAALHPLLEERLARLPAVRLADGVEVRLACDDRGRVSVALERAAAEDADRLLAAGIGHGVVVLEGEREVARSGDPVLVGEVAPGYGPGGAGDCRSDAGVFTQATRFGGRAILEAVLRAADAKPEMEVIELFAGAGHLTVPLLEKGARVRAVEGARRSVRFLEENARRFGERCVPEQRMIDERLPLPSRVDVLVADPPRAGVPGLASILERCRTERLVLVACDPATGARDLATALGRGFALSWLQPIDAFPRTTHVEWVAALARG